jgi:hypothetical protein
MSSSTRPYPSVKVGSKAATCPTALELASLMRRAPERHVSCGSGSCLTAGRDLGCHTSCGTLWATGLKYKEKTSRPRPT